MHVEQLRQVLSFRDNFIGVISTFQVFVFLLFFFSFTVYFQLISMNLTESKRTINGIEFHHCALE